MKMIKQWFWKVISTIGYLFCFIADRLICVFPDEDDELCPNCLTNNTERYSLDIWECGRCGMYFVVEPEENNVVYINGFYKE